MPLEYCLNIHYSADGVPRLFQTHFITQTRTLRDCQNILELHVVSPLGPFYEQGEWHILCTHIE